jgi:nondiscriminating glutamyl-tRNA synthetase
VAGTEPVGEKTPAAKAGFDERSFNRIGYLVYILGNRLKLLKDVPALMGYFLKDDFKRDEAAVKAHLSGKEAAERLSLLAAELEKVQFFVYESVEEAVRGLADRLNIQAGELIHPCRVALTGRTVSPDIFHVIIGLGKVKTVERLRNAASAAC